MFGDEPLLMARKAGTVPVWVGPARWLSGKAAIRTSGAEVLLMDDGFQHLSLYRNLDIVLLDAHNPFGNGRLLPFGPLREPVAHLDRADAIILTRAEDPGLVARTRSMLARMFPGKPIFACRHGLSSMKAGFDGCPVSSAALAKQRAVAFAGIARPAPFFLSLESTGIKLAATFAFSDHHPYTEDDTRMLMRSVKKTGARFLITTEKDAMRLPSRFLPSIVSVGMEMDFGAESDEFRNFIRSRISRLMQPRN
jgi:tetraacyldisaccharide 4'-kinase